MNTWDSAWDRARWMVECTTCGGFITDGPAMVLYPAAQTHHEVFHGRNDAVIVHRDFVVSVAPLFCDFCHVHINDRCWRHVCNPPVFDHGDTDTWCLCDPCHADAVAGAVEPQVARIFRQHRVQLPYLPDEELLRYVPAWRRLIERVHAAADDGVRVEFG